MYVSSHGLGSAVGIAADSDEASSSWHSAESGDMVI